MRRTLRNIHLWIGVLSSIFLLLLTITGIALNHPNWFSDYQKPALEQSIVGMAYHPNDEARYFLGTRDAVFDVRPDQMRELPLRFSNKGLFGLKTNDTHLYLFYDHGLVLKSRLAKLGLWQRMDLPDDSGYLKAFDLNQSRLIVHTTRGLYEYDGQQWHTVVHKGATLYELFYAIHSGYFPKPWYRWVNDITAIFVIVLIITGLMIAFRRFNR